MTQADHLMALEKQFWTEGSEYYREHVDQRCLLAFGSMTNVLSNAEVAETVRGQRWQDPELRLKGVVEPTPGFAIISYEATAHRADGETYSAVVSSGYVNRAGEWKLAFHQQTPT